MDKSDLIERLIQLSLPSVFVEYEIGWLVNQFESTVGTDQYQYGMMEGRRRQHEISYNNGFTDGVTYGRTLEERA